MSKAQMLYFLNDLLMESVVKQTPTWSEALYAAIQILEAPEVLPGDSRLVWDNPSLDGTDGAHPAYKRGVVHTQLQWVRTMEAGSGGLAARQASHDAGMQKLKDAAAERPPYVAPKPTKRLTKNAARCTHCKTVVESKHRHDWVGCKCGKIFVDGGLVYQRFGFSVPEDFEDLSEWAPVEPEPEKP